MIESSTSAPALSFCSTAREVPSEVVLGTS